MRAHPIPGTLVIGLGHRARHGKDSAAQLLVRRFAGVQRFSFADDLYAICRVLHGMRTKDAPLLQKVGVHYRAADEDVWIRSVDSKIRDAPPRVAVITDVRFPNEFAYVKAMGGACWKVERQLPDGSAYVDPSRPATHVSETALDDAPWDAVLVNPDGDQAAFEDAVACAYVALVQTLEAA